MTRSSLLGLLALTACGGANHAPSQPIPPAPSQAGAIAHTPAPFEKDVLAWVVVRNLDGSLARLAQQVGAGEGSPEGLRQALAVKFTGSPDLADALDTARPVAVALIDPVAEPSEMPYVLRVPITSREAFLESLATSFPRVAEPGPERHVFQRTHNGRIYVAFEGAPAEESALIAFRPGIASRSVGFFSTIAGRPPSDLLVRANVAAMKKHHDKELAAGLLKLLFMTSPGSLVDARSAHATRLVRRALGFVSSARMVEARIDLGAEGVAMVLRIESDARQEGNRLAEHIADQEPAPVWGAEVVPPDAMLVYATHTTRSGRQEDARELVKYVSGKDAAGRKPGAAAVDEHEGEADADATGLALNALGDALQGDAIYAVWSGEGGGIGVGGALRVKDERSARKRAMDAYDALGPMLGQATAMELGLDPAKFRFKARIRRNAARVAGQPVDLVELSPVWPQGSAPNRKLFQWLFGDRLVLGMAFIGEHALYAAGRDWKRRLEGMVRSARGEKRGSIAQVPSFTRALALHRDGRVSLAYVLTPLMATFVTKVVRSTSGLQPEQQAMLDPFLKPGTDADAVVASTNVRTENGRAVYELHTHLPSAAVAEMGRLGGAMWRVGLAPIFGPPSLPPLPTPLPNVTPPAD